MSNPSLARKVRRVARARRDGFYSSIEDALAEVQGLSHVESKWNPKWNPNLYPLRKDPLHCGRWRWPGNQA